MGWIMGRYHRILNGSGSDRRPLREAPSNWRGLVVTFDTIPPLEAPQR